MRRVGCGGWIRSAALLLAALAAEPCATAQTASTPIQTTEQSTAIHGVVVNASTGQPVGRALVQVEGHSLLTGSDGKFEFAGLSGTTVPVRVTKPGFYEGLDPYRSAEKQAAVGSEDTVQVALYPEALLTGTVSAPDGDPLAQVQVQALRLLDDQSGRRWIMAGQTSTNGDGQFRLPVQGGDYVVQTQYMPARPGAHGTILPVMMPPGASSPASVTGGAGDGASTLRLASGTEQHLDLRPPVRPGHAVHVQIDSAGGAEAAQFAQLQVHMANGLVFSPMQSRGDRSGEVVVSLPNGSYLLSASTGMRDDAASYGETRVAVADEDVAGVTIHLQKALELPLEVSVDPAATAGGTTAGNSASLSNPEISPESASFVQQLGIFLQRTSEGASLRTENASPVSHQGGPAAFMLLPGVYRLRSQGYSQWYVESATAGGTDLLTQDLAVDGGSSSLPLRLVVSNQMATVKGTTKLAGQAAECYVSLVASTPSATPVISARSATDGSFWRGIPPGSYSVVASETRLYLDLSDPAVQKQLAPFAKMVTVGAGETANLDDLDAIPASELKP